MVYGGFERNRETLKYRCPARYSGITCKGIEQCPVGDAVRIRLAEDRRVFTPVARSSYQCQTRLTGDRSPVTTKTQSHRLCSETGLS